MKTRHDEIRRKYGKSLSPFCWLEPAQRLPSVCAAGCPPAGSAGLFTKELGGLVLARPFPVSCWLTVQAYSWLQLWTWVSPVRCPAYWVWL